SLSWDTNDSKLLQAFSRFGEITEAKVITDRDSGRSRGFGFVTFEDDEAADDFDFARADYRILIALREDYLAHLESLKGTMPSITQNRMRLARMTGAQALSAVMKPGGRLVSQEVAESIVRFVAGRFGTGKSFLLNLIRTVAIERKFVVAQADITTQRRLHASGGEARNLYGELMKNLCSRGRPDG
ncbi:BREX system ATP-binding domain-containing protein, partial [Staphylococcus aureus]|uniref:BREX system ATP-binding domain-containing protein n=1 Tax=Staphylococcus aureus TaxID=1280 RepID=UPI00237B1A3A